MATHFTAGMGALWVQVDGPNTQPVYLGCHQLGDIEEPQGDVELIYCPDPSAPNRFKVVGSVQGAAGSVTSSLTTDVTDDLDYLERVLCPFPLYVNMIKSGRKDVFTNFDRAFVLTGARITSKGLTALAARTPDDNTRSEQSFDLSGESLLRFVVLELSRQSTSEANGMFDITFCNEQTCRTDEDVAQAACETGYIACAAAGGGTANVMRTVNGSTWAPCAADPFAADEDVIAVECFETGRDAVRVVVARGTTDASNPPEIAYTDDSGATWTAVDVGSDNTEFVQFQHAMYAHDRNAIWLGTDKGVLYKSEDAGLTWTQVDDGTLLGGEGVNSIHFCDADVGFVAGDANAFARSLDGGDSWSAITGPAAGVVLNVVFCLDRNRVWVGTAGGELWYSNNGGTTWAERSFTGTGVGMVNDIKFMNDHVGYLAKNVAVPANGGSTIQYTIDGGYTWTALTTPENDGLNSVWLCDLWNVYCVGAAESATGFIGKGIVA